MDEIYKIELFTMQKSSGNWASYVVEKNIQQNFPKWQKHIFFSQFLHFFLVVKAKLQIIYKLNLNTFQ